VLWGERCRGDSVDCLARYRKKEEDVSLRRGVYIVSGTSNQRKIKHAIFVHVDIHADLRGEWLTSKRRQGLADRLARRPMA
jgi:hypothetical protein